MESKRQKQVGALIKRNFSSVLMEQGIYLYGQAMVSVTDVKMSPDLKVAKIYISIFNTEDKDSVYEILLKNTTFLKQDLVKKIRKHVRRIPDIRIYKDDLLDEMYRIDQMLDDLD